jgi:hypothetical protein
VQGAAKVGGPLLFAMLVFRRWYSTHSTSFVSALGVKRRHAHPEIRLPVYPSMQTSNGGIVMSEKCHEATSHRHRACTRELQGRI